MKFFKNKILNKNHSFMDWHFKINQLGFFFVALLVCYHTILNAQLITTPTLQQQGTLQQAGGTFVSAPNLQNGGVKSSVNDPSINEEDGPCGIDEKMKEHYKNDPEFERLINKNIKTLVKEVDSLLTNRNRSSNPDPKVIVPVVFHYFYDECAIPGSYETYPPADAAGVVPPLPLLSNIRFENAVRILNEDFSGVTQARDDGIMNQSYEASLLADAPISFKLAEIDENGNPTNGINRIKNGITYAGVGYGPKLREIIQWPRNKYLNIYVVEKASGFSSGIACLPEVSDDSMENTGEIYDGIAMSRWAFDPTFSTDGIWTSTRDNYRGILSHEVGHWLGLRHLWGDAYDTQYKGIDDCEIDDFDFLLKAELASQYNAVLGAVDDTGNCKKPPTGAICGTAQNCITAAGDLPDDDRNLMDYSDCQVLFTNGQKDFMKLALASSLSKRNEIILNDNVFYPNDNTKSVVFNNGHIFSNVKSTTDMFITN